jgi:ribonuclease D
MIETPDGLRNMVARVRNEPCMALDTEFVWDRTYYARLGLVQIGLADGTCYLIDSVALPDLAPVGELLANPALVKILHDAPQDLMILRRATGVSARNIFDTRLAAGFAGLASTLSLGNLLAELLDVHLAKAHTRADWVARPLAPEVLDYAADDVRYLPAAATLLRDRARATGVEAWLDEELAALDSPELYEEKAPADAYQRIRVFPPLPPRSLAVLRELAAWREEAARRADLPRKWLLEDKDLVALATQGPRNREDLEDGVRLGANLLQRHGDDMLAAVQRGLSLPESDWPAPMFQLRRDPPFKKEVDAAYERIQALAAQIPIDTQLVCSRNELAKRLQEGGELQASAAPLWSGWRTEFMGRRAGP